MDARPLLVEVARALRLAKLEAVLIRPFYPASDLYRIVRDEDGLQLDFMARIHGPRGYEGLRDRAGVITIDGESLRVAAPQSWNVPMKRKRPNRRQPLAPAKRTNFLRRRVGLRATAR